MSDNYFNFFPLIEYDVKKNGITTLVTDITKRFSLRNSVLNKPENFYTYVVKEEERPDIVAQKEYDNSNLDWLVLFCNKILDPVWEWPMGYYDFNEYLKGKYGSIEYTQTTVLRYEEIVQCAITNDDGTVIPERTIIVDFTRYTELIDSKRKKIYIYNYENDLNEQRKHIKLLSKVFLPQIIEEAKLILR